MDYDMDYSRSAGTDILEHLRNSDDDLWNQFVEDEKQIARLVAQGKRWTHTCPECGRTFQNDEPEKEYLCDECGRKELQKLFDERKQELCDMERESARRRQSAIESRCRLLASKGYYINPKDPDRWIEFWDMCAANGKKLERIMTKS